jgi:hypothetical protein
LSVAYSSLIGQPLCFVGALVDFRREALRFVDDKLSVVGYAYATFRVDEMLWGGSGVEYQVYVRNVDVPGVVEYELGHRSVPISESKIGSKYIVTASMKAGHLYVRHVDFIYRKDEVAVAHLQPLAGALREAGELISFENQFNECELAVEGAVIDIGMNHLVLSVNRVLKGAVDEDRVEILRGRFPPPRQSDSPGYSGESLSFPEILRGDRCLVFVKKKGQVLHTLYSGYSVFLLSREGYRLGDGSHRPLILELN